MNKNLEEWGKDDAGKMWYRCKLHMGIISEGGLCWQCERESLEVEKCTCIKCPLHKQI